MANFIHIKSISELHEMFGYRKPGHPLISVMELSQVEIPEEILHQKISSPFYNITLKTKTTQSFKYGREYFDFAEGTLLGMSPDQVTEIDESSKKGDMAGWSLHFHPDLIRQSDLFDRMTNFSFFSYNTNEALHLSEKEKDTLNGIVEKIIEEYESGIDEFSQGVLVANLDLLLSYIKRFYSRQFVTRKEQNTRIENQFQQSLVSYFNSERISINGLPKVSHFARELHLSESYLSELLRKETGKNTQEHIHAYVIEQAKNRLINTDATVSEIAFDLGFEYPQYFSRLFKKKTGKTPIQFRSHLN